MNEAQLNNSGPRPSVIRADAAPRVRINCPHCQAPAKARTSKSLSPIYREITYQCTNVHCGHTYVAGLEIVRTLSPSAIPNAAIDIPLSPHMQREPVQS